MAEATQKALLNHIFIVQESFQPAQVEPPEKHSARTHILASLGHALDATCRLMCFPLVPAEVTSWRLRPQRCLLRGHPSSADFCGAGSGATTKQASGLDVRCRVVPYSPGELSGQGQGPQGMIATRRGSRRCLIRQPEPSPLRCARRTGGRQQLIQRPGVRDAVLPDALAPQRAHVRRRARRPALNVTQAFSVHEPVYHCFEHVPAFRPWTSHRRRRQGARRMCFCASLMPLCVSMHMYADVPAALPFPVHYC